ncbi:MAG: CPBP family intramembrane glutamic endopeptidase [Pseudomonadota bacterium]
MNASTPSPARIRALLVFLAVMLLGILIKGLLDQVSWRYSGPMTLAIVLSLLLPYYLRVRGDGPSALGLVPLRSAKQWLLLIPQTLLAFLCVLATMVAIGLAAEAVGITVSDAEAQRANTRFGELKGNTPLYLSWLAILWFAGPAEELYFRGIMIHQLREGLGRSRAATVLSVVLPALVFGVGHLYYQGLRGLIGTAAIGLVLGTLFLAYRRNLWPLMVAHASVNSLSFTALYFDLDI